MDGVVLSNDGEMKW